MSVTILRLDSVLKKRHRSRSAHYRDMEEGLCTSSIALGPRAVGWIENEIDTLIAARAAGMSDDEIRDLVRNLEAERKKLIPSLVSASGNAKDR